VTDAQHRSCRPGSVAWVDADLRRWWTSDLGSRAGSVASLDSLIGRYREPHRRYHTVSHVAAVRQLVGELLREIDAVDSLAIRLAAWYHDAVYDPTAARHANEAASAQLATDELVRLELPASTVATTARLILATASHDAADNDEAVLLDADLAVFAAQRAVYLTYVAGVRFEYRTYDDNAWRAGRTAVLQSFLGRDAIFHTKPMKPHERQARANLEFELATLS
jgi:predicted metal-dependent HD superfamily phosphohydrolase